MRILITGGAGFIGGNFVRHLLAHYPQFQLTNLDALTYAGNEATVASLPGEFPDRYEFVRGDICDAELTERLFAERSFYAVVNFAAESHVDRSIDSPQSFIHTNIVGTGNLLENARKHGVRRFLQVSTDEVYGSLGAEGRFTEDSPLKPSSPYSASKTGADLLALACYHTYKQDVVVTRCSNNYGPYQFPEKLIPLMIVTALADKPLPVYGDGLNVRDWIHVEHHCSAVVSVLLKGRAGQVYNVGSDSEMRNIDVVKGILSALGKPESLISYVTDRPGHDRRYAIDSSKIQQEIGWKPAHRFQEGLASTVEWYLNNREWWEPLLPGNHAK